MAETTLPAIEINPPQPAQASVIWLHGLGANGSDFADLAGELQKLTQLPIRFILPHAPQRPVTLNSGYIMPAWYDIIGLDLASRQDKEGIQASERAINALIQNELAQGINSEHIVLAGFSQGGAIALHTGLRYPARLGGILALSTYLPLEDSVEEERALINQPVPIFFAHGDADNVIPLAWAQASCQRLIKLSYNIDWRVYPMQHNVCSQEIADISGWLQSILRK
jgi:phospholipase/carboxylesterase